ncbi:MAG: flagellar biosynthesis protein FlhF [Gammaproteobacteria bacterium]
MKVKRYFASNMRSALDMIKEEQGPDVLILSNRKVDGGVELITADELSEQEANELAARGESRRRSDVAAVAEKTEVPAASPAAKAPRPAWFPDGGDSRDLLWTDAGTVAQMREELQSLKGLLENQLCGLAWSEFGSRHPLRARLMRVLAQVGISATLAREQVAEVPDEIDNRARRHRVQALQVLRLNVMNDPILRHGGRVALLGATGVGKTTLVSKLAARQALAHGADSVAVISMDDRRLGAGQQIKAFGRLIGSAVYTLRNATELSEVLEENAARALVLIDTPGHAPGHPACHEFAAMLERLGGGIQMFNVLSATTDYLSALRALRAAADLPLDACILTKLDEAATLGPSLSAIIETGLPLAYTSAGQQVPDDLDQADARALIERAVALAKAAPTPGDRTRLEQAFSA